MSFDEKLLKSKCALIVIDKQAGYFDPVLVAKRGKNLPQNSSQTLELIDSFIESARKSKVEVIWTQMVEDINASPKNIATKMSFDIHQSISTPGNQSYEIYGRVKPLTTEKIIKKMRYNAFSDTDLADYLRSISVETVILIGGYGSRCVLSTAVGANGEDLSTLIPRGLIINQLEDQSEVNTVYSAVNAIFGATLNVDDIYSYWAKNLSK